MFAYILRIEGRAEAFLIEIEEHVAVHVLGLEHVGSNVAGLGLNAALAEYFILVQVIDDQIDIRIQFLEALFRLEHLGGGGVHGQFSAFRLGLLVELGVGHGAPVVIDRAVCILSENAEAADGHQDGQDERDEFFRHGNAPFTC